MKLYNLVVNISHIFLWNFLANRTIISLCFRLKLLITICANLSVNVDFVQYAGNSDEFCTASIGIREAGSPDTCAKCTHNARDL